MSPNSPENELKETIARLEQELYRKTLLLDILPSAVPWAMWLKDTAGNFLFRNQVFESIIISSGSDIVSNRIPGGLSESLLQQYEDIVLTEKKENNIEFSFGKTWFRVYIAPWFEQNTQLGGVFGMARDISKEKNAILDLQAEQEYFRTLMDNIPDTIYFKDTLSRFTRINKAKARSIGLQNPADAIGKTDFDFFEKGKAQEAFNDEADIFRTGKSLVDKIEKLRDRQGNDYWVSATKIPVRNKNGQITGLVGISKNITDFIITENKLEEAKKKAEESDRLKTAFLANMSHDIRTPMNGIVGFANLLKNDNLDPQTRNEYLGIINSCSNTLLTLIDDIIDISKIEASQLKILESKCHLNVLLRDLYKNFDKIRLANRKNHINLIMKPASQDEHFVIITDPNRLQQILTNLIGNALKFTDEGYVEFGYDIKNSFLEFYVKDTGIGIPESMHKAIFERFVKVEDKNSMNPQGTGLGLAISSQLVKLMGGDIRVESIPRKGSTFFFTLPFVPAQDTQALWNSNMPDESLNWSGKSVLIAEDEESNFIFLRESLKNTGIKVVRAKNGEEVLALFRENPSFDLVLMDIKMPVMDGYTTTIRLRAMDSRIPVIAQTAFAMIEDRQKALQVGCNDFICKPIIREQLLNMMKHYIEKH